MSQHTGPAGPPASPAPTEPSYSERARTLVHLASAGTLATASRRRPGHPFASVMPYAPDDEGRPVVLISRMAMHTQNLEADPRASLLVTQPGFTDDPLAGARVTLMATARPLSGEEARAARSLYLARYPRAKAWADFDDFGFWRLEMVDVYFVGGFAAMDWIAVPEYTAAHPDPLAGAAASIIEHMNRDHADALVLLARAFADTPADEATMVSVDRLGFRLRVRSGERLSGARIAFPREVRSAEESRTVLIEMVKEARRRSAR
jgi:heme oxygenase (biliverdin-IX-beta and delta-forming)